MRIVLRAVGTALLLAPLSFAAAQSRGGGMGGGGPRGGMMRGDQDPVSFLIENNKEIGLADDQVTQLRSLRRELREQNKPLLDALEQVMPGGGPMMGGMGGGRPGRGGGMDGRMGGGRPGGNGGGGGSSGGTVGEDTTSRSFQMPDTVRTLMSKLRANTEAARTRAYDVLSDDQKAKATELEEQWRQQMGGRRSRGRGAGVGGGHHGA